MAGRRKYHQKQRSVFAQIRSSTKVKTGDYPSNFSWKQYLSPPRQQQRCGSCYAIATMEMLSARLKKNGENVDLSPQYSVDCNYYNQGCDGGYPFLVEKFFNENYLATEEQYPYKAITKHCDQVNFDNQDKLY
jgi:cathepsin C